VAGTVLESGSEVEALVLDVAKAERLVDLTLKPEFFNSSKESSRSRTDKKVIILSCTSSMFTFWSQRAEKNLSNFFDTSYMLSCYGSIFM